MPAFHRPCQKCASELAGGAGRDRKFKEYPDVAAVPRTRTLENRRHAQLPTGIEKCVRVIGPCLLIEIDSEKPAGFVQEKRIDANGLFPEEMVLDNRVGQRQEFSRDPVNLLPICRFARIDGLPILQRCR